MSVEDKRGRGVWCMGMGEGRMLGMGNKMEVNGMNEMKVIV